MKKGKFITFEGIDGAGKSSIIKMIEKKIQSLYPNQQFIITREPGGTNCPEAEQVRKIILNPANKLSQMSEVILFAASRRIHIDQIINPALEKNIWVFSDRYLDSSLAYQTVNDEVSFEDVKKINDIATNNLYPDLTFWFDIPVSESIKRIASNTKDRIENKSENYFEKVKLNYEKLLNIFPSRFIRIDATLSKKEVFENIWTIFKERIIDVQ